MLVTYLIDLCSLLWWTDPLYIKKEEKKTRKNSHWPALPYITGIPSIWGSVTNPDLALIPSTKFGCVHSGMAKHNWQNKGKALFLSTAPCFISFLECMQEPVSTHEVSLETPHLRKRFWLQKKGVLMFTRINRVTVKWISVVTASVSLLLLHREQQIACSSLMLLILASKKRASSHCGEAFI